MSTVVEPPAGAHPSTTTTTGARAVVAATATASSPTAITTNNSNHNNNNNSSSNNGINHHHSHQQQHSTSDLEYFRTDGPVDPDLTLIRFDTPFAPDEPKKTMKLRQKLGLPAEMPQTDPNVRTVLDSFIQPREWYDAAQTRWVQHASAEPAARIDVTQTRERLHAMLKQQDARATGVCPVRTFLHSEAFVEVIRQTVCESWERGLLLLKLRGERVQSQKAHRELFESRTGYAFRLALKGEKDTAAIAAKIDHLQKRKAELEAEEAQVKIQCDEFAVKCDEEVRLDEKRYNEEANALKKEANQKRSLLEHLTIPKGRLSANFMSGGGATTTQ